MALQMTENAHYKQSAGSYPTPRRTVAANILPTSEDFSAPVIA